MSRLRTVVAATDLSAPSRHAAWRAEMLVRSAGASLTLVHTVGGTALDDLRRWLDVDGADAAQAVEADARRRLQDLADELGRRHGIDVRTMLTVGNPVEQITRHADALQADLLVTGTRGAGFMRGLVAGSTAERLARRSPRPVLLVRRRPTEPYRRVLVPVDFSAWSRSALALALQLAPRATIVLMHAVDAPYGLRLAGVGDDVERRCRDAARREAQGRLQELAAGAGLAADRVRLSTPDGADPWMLIVRQEEEHDCDLVVIGRQGRHALDELLLGSTTRMVIAEGTADVLISTRHPA